jgi:cell division cycle protein 20 (cofactor of APC complex)
MNLELCRVALFADRAGAGKGGDEDGDGGSSSSSKAVPVSSDALAKNEYKRRMLSSLCNVPLESLDEESRPRRLLAVTEPSQRPSHAGASSEQHKRRRPACEVSPSAFHRHDILRVVQQFDTFEGRPADASSAGSAHAVAEAARLARRRAQIPDAPYKHLYAPGMVNDFYLNLISWSADNLLAVALEGQVYVWNPLTSGVQLLVDDGSEDDDYLRTSREIATPIVTSISWCKQPGRTHHLAVGYDNGRVQVWDGQALRKVGRDFSQRTRGGRVTAMAWNEHCLTLGGERGSILQLDARMRTRSVVAEYQAHTQKVCGLKWNGEGTVLASGGNDNLVCLWDACMSGAQPGGPVSHRRGLFGGATTSPTYERAVVRPRSVLTDHTAAVKAMDWCPFTRGLLATGGGTEDTTVKLWNTHSGSAPGAALLNSTYTGSQVCSLLWSRTGHHRELVTAHGFPNGQLSVWKYGTAVTTHATRSASEEPCSLTKIKSLSVKDVGRTLNLEGSPDGRTVASVSDDEGIRLWTIFDGPTVTDEKQCRRRRTDAAACFPTFGTPSIR